MALVKCPDCGRDISDQAPACIGCGRPQEVQAEPVEVCEVTLRLITGGVLRAQWALEAHAMTPDGVRLITSCDYHSDNAVADYQGEAAGFQEARARITSQLLRAGWEPTGSVGVGGSITLPQFQRRAGVLAKLELTAKERVLRATEGTGLGGVAIRRLHQMGLTVEATFNVVVDRVNKERLGPGAIVRLDLTPGAHTIFCQYKLTSTGIVELTSDAASYKELVFGYVPSGHNWYAGKGKMGVTPVLRDSAGQPLSPTDKGKPFIP